MFGIMEALMSFIRRQVGLRTDAADAGGSLHGKIGNIKNEVNVVNSAIGGSSDIRSSNTIMGWLSSPIKSVQYGTVAFSYSDTSKTITISSINTSKSILIPLGRNFPYLWAGTGEMFFGCWFPRLSLTNATTVTAVRGEESPSGLTLTVGFMVVEFY